MRIVLANMPWSKNGKMGIRAGSRWPHLKDDPESNYLPYPFFLGYAASLLENYVDDTGSPLFTVRFIDAICEEMSEDVFLKEVQLFRPDFFLAETSTVSLNDDLRLIEKLDKKFWIALSGPDTIMYDEGFLKKTGYIDFILRGEYEFHLLELVKSLHYGMPLLDVKGINYRDHNGDVVVTDEGELGDINTLPWPKREAHTIYRYLDAPGAMPYPTAQILASRGCPYTCKFCLWPQVMYHGRSYRVRDIRDVLDEMEHVIQTYGFKSVYFDDDTFGLNKEWLQCFCEELIVRKQQKRINVPWAMMTRPDIMTEVLLVKMKHAGLWAVKYGLESTNQELVNNIEKNLDVAYAKKIIHYTQSIDIKTHLTFTFGLPGETSETVASTIKDVQELNPHSVQFSITTPFPGTSYYKYTKERGQLLSDNLDEYDGNTTSVICTDHLSQNDLVKARRLAYQIWDRHVKMRRVGSLCQK